MKRHCSLAIKARERKVARTRGETKEKTWAGQWTEEKKKRRTKTDGEKEPGEGSIQRTKKIDRKKDERTKKKNTEDKQETEIRGERQ
jgi:hypothetical protein